MAPVFAWLRRSRDLTWRFLLTAVPEQRERCLLAILAAMGVVLFLSASLSLLTGHPARWLRVPAPSSPPPVTVEDTADLDRLFQRLGYRLDLVRSGIPVPLVVLARLPGDWPGAGTVSRRKARFIRVLLPLVLRANARVVADRRHLLSLLRAGEMSAADRDWVVGLANAYRVAGHDHEALVRRVDAIPPALAIAQAAVESAWGTSRFARQGNALFGQWTTTKGGGIVPERRSEGASHEVKAFPSLEQAVESYLKNLNTHGAYRALRATRATMRKADRPLDAQVLAAGLALYSERGVRYVWTLRAVIRENRLESLDGARLATKQNNPGQMGPINPDPL